MEKAELLRDTDANLLPALLRLQELVRMSSLYFLSSGTLHCLCEVMKGEWECFFLMNNVEVSVWRSFIILLVTSGSSSHYFN